MNYTVEELVARLNNGESADSLAKEMTELLNQASAIQKQKEEESEKCADWAEVAVLLYHIIVTYYPRIAARMKGIDASKDLGPTLMQQFDLVEKELDGLLGLLDLFEVDNNMTAKSKDDAILQNFLKSICP